MSRANRYHGHRPRAIPPGTPTMIPPGTPTMIPTIVATDAYRLTMTAN